MLSKAQISLVTSLQHKKFRKQHGLFIVEGIKSVAEFINSTYSVQTLFYTEGLETKLGKIPHKIKSYALTAAEFQKISSLTHPQGVLALVEIPAAKELSIADLQDTFTICLDDIQDPGNLGTIIRTAEWFGFKQIICSAGTVDAYNNKVVQATMGSLARVEVIYTDLIPLFQAAKLPVYGALLAGENIYQTDFAAAGFIVMGNEGNGLSTEVIAQVDKAVTIPRIGDAESLNVAVATTIFCSEIVRKRFL